MPKNSSSFFVALMLAVATSAGQAQQAASEDQVGLQTPDSTTVAPQPQPVVGTIAVPQPPPEPAPLAEEAGVVQLESVVVTATKRAKSLREIPASISHISGEDLERRGAQGIEDILRTVPGVQFATDDTNGSRVTTRGIAGDGPTSATTGVFFGDLSFSDAYVPFVFLNPHPFDLEGVEVLKGPQGTLFGASALNGVVRYVPQKAVIDEWQTRYLAQASQISEGQTGYDLGGAMNVPIGSALAVRLVGIRRWIPGYVDNLHPAVNKPDSNSGEQTHVRALVTWQPDADWDIGFIYGWQDTLINDGSATDNEERRLSSGNRPSLQSNHAEYQMGDLTVKYTFGSLGQIVSDTGYVLKDGLRGVDASAVELDPPPTSLQVGVVRGHSTTLSQEVRWLSPDSGSPWTYVAGVFAWQQRIKNREEIVVGVSNLLPLSNFFPLIPLPVIGPIVDPNGNLYYATLDFDVKVTELATFGEITRKLGDDWSLTLGGRLYRTTSGGVNAVGGLAAIAGLPSRPLVLDRTISEQGFSPKASIVYEPNKQLMSYATVSRGFRVGGVQPSVAVIQDPRVKIPQVFKSDTIWSYEGGVRTTWLQNTLHLDASAYYIDWRNPQLAQPDSAGEGSIYLSNAGGVHGKGLELSMQYLAPFGLRLAGGASFSRTLTSKPFAAPNGDEVPVGTRWLLAPEKQITGKLTWPIYVGEWIVMPDVTYSYIGDAPYSFLFKGNVFGYHQWDAQLGVRNESLRWMPEIALVGTNLGNVHAQTGLVKTGTPAGGEFVNYIQPRTLMLRISGQF